MANKTVGEIQIRDNKYNNSVELLVPVGMSHKELSKIKLGDLLSKFRPSGCQACLSGQHFNIRERFQKVLQVDIASGKVGKVI
ncbi:hypothetical protein BH11BAC4_BH11BAC4_03880 [soil metagenome]